MNNQVFRDRIDVLTPDENMNSRTVLSVVVAILGFIILVVYCWRKFSPITGSEHDRLYSLIHKLEQDLEKHQSTQPDPKKLIISGRGGRNIAFLWIEYDSLTPPPPALEKIIMESIIDAKCGMDVELILHPMAGLKSWEHRKIKVEK